MSMQQGSPDGESAAAPDAATLAMAVCARVCHDLAGSLGALIGTLEIAAEARDSEALELARDCARELSARMQLLRSAWSPDGAVPDLAMLTDGLPGADRLEVDLSALAPDLDDEARQLALNLLLAAAQALPRGGTIRLQGAASGLNVSIEGRQARWADALQRCLAGGAALREAAGTPRDIPAVMLCLLAGRLGFRLRLDASGTLSAAPG